MIRHYKKLGSTQKFEFGGVTTHGTVIEDPWEFTNVSEIYYGVYGEATMTDAVHGRFLALQVDWLGAADEAALVAGLNTVNSYINQLKGELWIGNIPDGPYIIYPQSLFLGYYPDRNQPRQYYGGTIPGWGQVGGHLLWRQQTPLSVSSP